MKKRQIHFFFKTLAVEWCHEADVILIGASAASLMGHVRPSLDIDFEIRPKSRSAKVKQSLVEAIQKASQIAGLAVNYSENVGGWSRINYLDYRKTATRYQKFGKLNVELIAPEYWTIGKMARFLELDIQDMQKIITKKRLKQDRLIQIWARALRASDLSLELGQFREHVVYFLEHFSRKLWGKTTDPLALIRQFDKISTKQ